MDHLAALLGPIPPSVLAGLSTLREGSAMRACPTAALTAFVRTGRPLSSLSHYVPGAPSARQVAYALQSRSAAHVDILAGLEAAFAERGVSIARHQSNGNKDDAAAHTTLRLMIADDLGLLARYAPTTPEPCYELQPDGAGSNWLDRMIAE